TSAGLLGLDPGDKYTWDGVSGGLDGLFDIGLDPLTWAGGIFGGIRNVKNVPRYVSRKEALGLVFNPNKSSKLGFGLFDRGIIPRTWWGFTSKHIDEFADSKDAWKAWNWIADNADDAADLLVRYPGMKNIPVEELERLASQKTGEQVKDVYQRLISDAPQPGAKTASITDMEMAKLLAPRAKYRQAQKQALELGEANLRGMNASHDGVHADQIFEPVRRVATQSEAAARFPGGSATMDQLDEVRQFDFKQADDLALDDADKLDIPETVRALEEGNITPESLIGDGLEIFIDSDGKVLLADGNHRLAILEEFGYDGPVKVIVNQLSGTVEATAAEAGVELIGRAAVNFAEETGVYRNSQFTGSGADRAVVATVGRGPVQLGDLADPDEFNRMLAWLNQDGMGLQGTKELAAALEGGVPLDQLTEAQRNLLRAYMKASAKDGVKLGGMTLLDDTMDQYIFNGLDDKVAKSVTGARPNAALEMETADRALMKMRASQDANIFFTIDLPSRKLTTKLQSLGHTLGRRMGNGRYMQGMRRQGFQMAHALPGAISLTHGPRGAIELRNWIKALGGGEDLAVHWMRIFLDGNMTIRQKTVQDAISAVGETIDNPQLREGLVQFFSKQGQQTFSTNRAGVEIGQTAQGSILPMTITHLTNEMTMPNAKELIKTVRRFKGKGSTPLHRRGFLQGTKDRRKAIVTRLKANMTARGLDTTRLTDDEWLAVGYADVLTQITGRTRADAFGAVNKMASMAYTPFRMLHNVFTIGQLAFRPLAWSGRILMEETIRADLVGLPSLWKNPYQYIFGIMDSTAIYRLSKDAAGQGRAMDALVESKLFAGGIPDEGAILRVFPDIADRLKASNVDPKLTSRYKAFLAHELGRSLIGGEATTN
ncbi:hypothetical protein LCGC14_1815700, partial [marine sediment metagenome]